MRYSLYSSMCKFDLFVLHQIALPSCFGWWWPIYRDIFNFSLPIYNCGVQYSTVVLCCAYACWNQRRQNRKNWNTFFLVKTRLGVWGLLSKKGQYLVSKFHNACAVFDTDEHHILEFLIKFKDTHENILQDVYRGPRRRYLKRIGVKISWDNPRVIRYWL